MFFQQKANGEQQMTASDKPGKLAPDCRLLQGGSVWPMLGSGLIQAGG
jgi:hypothetical protein